MALNLVTLSLLGFLSMGSAKQIGEEEASGAPINVELPGEYGIPEASLTDCKARREQCCGRRDGGEERSGYGGRLGAKYSTSICCKASTLTSPLGVPWSTLLLKPENEDYASLEEGDLWDMGLHDQRCLDFSTKAYFETFEQAHVRHNGYMYRAIIDEGKSDYPSAWVNTDGPERQPGDIGKMFAQQFGEVPQYSPERIAKVEAKKKAAGMDYDCAKLIPPEC